ncbi:MAG: hypothetical protein AAF927_29865 [Bacteroidota bacterium]
MSQHKNYQDWAIMIDGEEAFPWNPKEGIMPKRPKSIGSQRRLSRPRRLPRRR